MLTRPDVILIAGPTASGKSKLAVKLALQHGGVVVNADSMQIYPVLDVLTARPAAADLATVPHALYGTAPVHASWSVARWFDDAKTVLDRTIASGQTVVFVGGTGLYFKALDEGLAEVPQIDPDVRTKVRADLVAHGAAALFEQLAAEDRDMAAVLRQTDGQRISRALEVVRSTGKSLKHFQDAPLKDSVLAGLNVQRYLLMPDRPLLHERINKRTHLMMANGAAQEVAALTALDLPPEATVLKAIGVKDLALYNDGAVPVETAIERIQALTRQYAKRQSTWFRGQFGKDWEIITSTNSI
ncbi:MAG: tRNA (adenosine(37)-N6)-dimethylallyltransferase MiaA [Pseudomonadota bacterium]